MKLSELLKQLDHTVTTSGVNFEDCVENFNITVNYDPTDSANNVCKIELDGSTIKLSEKKEDELFDYLHSLWIEEIEGLESDIEIKEERLNNIFSYGV